MFLLALVLGCGTSDEGARDEADAAEALAVSLYERPQSQGADVATPLAAEGAPPVEPLPVVLVWDGIGALHRGFFSDATAVRNLGLGLAGRLAPPANVYVRYDGEEHIGQIRLQIVPETLQHPIRSSGDVVSLQDLAPLTMALARYRDEVSGRFDLRVASFHIGLETIRGARACVFGVTGTPPPDGSVLSPCVEVNGVRHCGEPAADGARFSAEVARDIRACLDL